MKYLIWFVLQLRSKFTLKISFQGKSLFWKLFFPILILLLNFSGYADTIISILIDLNGFYAYENRESNIHAKDVNSNSTN